MSNPAAQKSPIVNADVIATLVERYDRAIRATELQYLPVKIAFVVVFLVTALTQNTVYGAVAGILVWLTLMLAMRPQVVVKLSNSSLGRVVPMFRRVPRWSFAVLCAVYLWYVTRATGWDGWSILVLFWVLDAAISMFETRQMNSYIHWKEQITQHHSS